MTTGQLMTSPASPVSGAPPARRWRLVLFSLLAGAALAVIWSPHLVDRVIAGGIADPVFGGNIGDVAITGSGMAVAFAFVTGVAGMFTACNVAVFCALAPMTAQRQSVRGVLATLARPIALLLAGAVVVAGLYGFVAVLVGPDMPQLSNARIGDPETGVRVRSVQAGVVFGLIGLIMVWRGLAYAGVVRNPLAGLFRRRPGVEMVLLGGLIGAFLIGRPFGPFRNMFSYAVRTENPLLGFVTFALQSAGNIVGVAVLFVLVTVLTRGRFQRWLAARPGRSDRFAAGAFLVVGMFFVVYWGVKIATRLAGAWWPMMPYNS
ncbi:hypothetical protein [Amycolatopsis suaedae]|uniref:Uncharacterized protein n=1 Tax=Amycolatopsis suaedae TaxID=2510978 RepID=A0A4Q7J3D7_9PSEU|nr:hypothetical protein [Amycolatopsis suaedae]RZQ61132.1 hypothetical protein EWH70_24930 [Amycolatopsis suaedae]